jgi:hypothetical protein
VSLVGAELGYKETDMKRRATLVILGLLLLLFPRADLADPPALMGSGNFNNGSAGATEAAKYTALLAAGCRICRFDAYPYDYWDYDASLPKASDFDKAVLQARTFGVTPMVLFEYYGTYPHLKPPIPMLSYDDWYAVGKAFAVRFQPNSAWWKG